MADDANSAVIVNVSPDWDVSIPSPPVTVSVSPKSISWLPLSVVTLIILFASLAFVTEASTNCEALIVLFVNVCVAVVVTNVLGKVIVLADKSKVVANLPAVTALSAILPVVTPRSASWLVPTPEALILKASPDTSIVVSSTSTSKVLPVFDKAAPALIWPAPENWAKVISDEPKVGVPLWVAT